MASASTCAERRASAPPSPSRRCRERSTRSPSRSPRRAATAGRRRSSSPRDGRLPRARLERRRSRASTCARRSTASRGTGSRSRRVSARYETEPVGEILDQPDFLNAAIRIRTALEPLELLDVCKAVEVEGGRDFGGAPPRPARRSTSTCCCSATSSSQTSASTLPHREVDQPPLRPRAAARAGSGPGAAGRDAAGRRARAAWRGRAGGAGGRALAPASRARRAAEPLRRARRRRGRGSPGTSRSASSPAGRPSIAGWTSSSVISRRDAGGDLEVGGVRARRRR